MNAFMLLLCLSGVNAETEEVIEDPSAKATKFIVLAVTVKKDKAPLSVDLH